MLLDELIRGAPIIFPPPLLQVPGGGSVKQARPVPVSGRKSGKITGRQAQRPKLWPMPRSVWRKGEAQRRGAKNGAKARRKVQGGGASCPLQVATPIGFAVLCGTPIHRAAAY